MTQSDEATPEEVNWQACAEEALATSKVLDNELFAALAKVEELEANMQLVENGNILLVGNNEYLTERASTFYQENKALQQQVTDLREALEYIRDVAMSDTDTNEAVDKALAATKPEETERNCICSPKNLARGNHWFDCPQVTKRKVVPTHPPYESDPMA